MLRRLSLLLIATLLFTPWSRAHQASHSLDSPASIQAVGNIAPTILPAPSSSRSSSLSPLSLASYRLKSPSEETDFLVPRASELRRVPLPNRAFSSLVPTPRSNPCRAVAPLRC